MSVLSQFKKKTPTKFKKIYHALKFNIQRLILLLFYRVKSDWRDRYYSQFGQDRVIKELIDRLKIKLDFLVDVGSNHPVLNNNTFYFEQSIKTICIDPLYTFCDYKLRCNTVFHQCAINNVSGESNFYRVHKVDGWEDQMSSFNRPEDHFTFTVEKIRVDRLENIIEKYINEHNKFGLLIDVEGSEDVVLETLNFERFRPCFILVETPALNFKLKNNLINKSFKYVCRVGPHDDLFVNSDIL